MAKKNAAPTKYNAPRNTAPKVRPSSESEGSSEFTSWLFPLLGILMVTAILYLPTLSHGYVNWDDDVNITENPNLIDPSGIQWANIFSPTKGHVIGNYNPLPILTFAIEKQVNGSFSPKLSHFNNLWLHLLCVFFVFKILLEMGIGKNGSLWGAALFAIHPMRVESVAWATERKDVLFGLFFFISLFYYIKHIKVEDSNRKQRYYIWMLVFAVLSLLSKVQAVALPLAMLAMDYWFGRPMTIQRILEKWPFWLLSLVFGLLNVWTLGMQGSLDDAETKYNLFDRLLVGAYSFCVYIVKLVAPYPMSPMYPYPKEIPLMIKLGPIGFFAVAYLIFWLWKNNKGKEWVFGTAFFFLTVMFVLQVVGAGQGFLADRFTYVPYFGFFAALAFTYDKYAKTHASMLNGIFSVALIAFSFITWNQVKIWKNGDTLWSHVIKFEGKTVALPWGNRGHYFREIGQFEKSLPDYSEAINISPDKPEQYNSRGKTYFDMAMSGKYGAKSNEYVANAIKDYSTGLSKPGHKDKGKSEMLINRGAALSAARQPEQAFKDFEAGIALCQKNAKDGQLDQDFRKTLLNAYLNRSLTYFNLGQYENAAKDHSEYLKVDPTNANIYYERGLCYRILSKWDLAIADLNQAIKMDPRQGLSYLERARAFAGQGNAGLARQDATKAVQLGAQLDPALKQALGM